ncbi:MAG: FHA domain-containing protein [Firmicutes bacterium]|nr:FHA domain-containing protein [Bacillota bacterium]
MIVKRLGIFFFVLIVGIGAGIFVIDHIVKTYNLPSTVAALVILTYITFFIIISFILGRDIPKETSENEVSIPSERKKGKGKNYAWLNPYATDSRAGYPITKQLMIIGRDVHADILVNDVSVSRKHAQILSLAGGFMLKDLESGNGTYINNQRIEEAYLGDGDLITFGEVKFIFNCSSVKPPSEITSASDIDITLDIDMDLEKMGDTAGTKSRVTGTMSGTRSGTRFKDLKERTYYPSSKKAAPEDDDNYDTGTRTGPKPTGGK